jgi:methionine synthase I (cobalamin-dependent)
MGRMNLKGRISQGLLLLDGGMGTQLFARGIETGTCNDYLNIESPDTILDIHRAYIRAFGANRNALGRHGLADEVARINTAAAEIARQAAGEDKYVLGDIGPSGEFLEPLGNLNPEELTDAVCEQTKALLAGGADGFIIETMTALDEIEIAIEAVKSVCGDLPVFASMAFDRAGGDFRTMMGVDIESVVSKAITLGVDAIGFNCGTATLDEYVKLAGKYVSAVRALTQDTLVLAEPNASKPELVDDKAVYKVSPEDFAEAAKKIKSAGVSIIGGCCGTGPEHIEAVAKELKK